MIRILWSVDLCGSVLLMCEASYCRAAWGLAVGCFISLTCLFFLSRIRSDDN
jgi:hypothetical protein